MADIKQIRLVGLAICLIMMVAGAAIGNTLLAAFGVFIAIAILCFSWIIRTSVISTNHRDTVKSLKKFKDEEKKSADKKSPGDVCPHCGKFIGFGDRDCCPECGKKIEDRIL